MKLNDERKLTQSQKMMVFVLSMALFGLSKMITEILPSNEIGPIEFSVSYFAFIPLILCVLFHPFYAALGASVGKIIFADLLMGDFSGLGELEGVIQLTLGMYVAGLIVKNPLNKVQLTIAALVGVGIDQILSSVVDIAKVWVGIEGFDAIPGLPESIVLLEVISFFNEMVITGVLFGVIPTLILVPRLYGKIEPLLGMKPREKRVNASMTEFIKPGLIFSFIALAFVSLISKFMAELEIDFRFWNGEFLTQFEGYEWIGISGGVIILIILLAIVRKIISNKKDKRTEERQIENLKKRVL